MQIKDAEVAQFEMMLRSDVAQVQPTEVFSSENEGNVANTEVHDGPTANVGTAGDEVLIISNEWVGHCINDNNVLLLT